MFLSLFFSLGSSFHCFDLSGARFLSSICSVQSILAIDTPRFSQTLAERTQRIDPRPVKSLVCLAADWGVFAVL